MVCVIIFVVTVTCHSLNFSYFWSSLSAKRRCSSILKNYCRKLNRMLGLLPPPAPPLSCNTWIFLENLWRQCSYLKQEIDSYSNHWNFWLSEKVQKHHGRLIEPTVHSISDKCVKQNMCSAPVQSQFSSLLCCHSFPSLTHSYLLSI